MNFEDAALKISQMGQPHVLQFWSRLTPCEQDALLAQIETLSAEDVSRLQNALSKGGEVSAPISAATMEPPQVEDPLPEQRAQYAEIGAEAIAAGRVGVVMVAGGQGSRLGFNGPKGCFPIGPVSGKSLFYFHIRKLVALKAKFGTPVHIYLMTSDTNDSATRTFFADNDYFGLEAECVHFFKQGMWPALSPDGKIILDQPGHIFMSPDGHGGTIAALANSGMIADMVTRGIDTLFYAQVDNPLMNLADPEAIGFHIKSSAECTLLVGARQSAATKVGMPVNISGKLSFLEYTLFPESCLSATNSDGSLQYRYGTLAAHIFSRQFLEREANAGLPINLAHKKIPFVNECGKVVEPVVPNAYKFEKFIFDSLRDAQCAKCFAMDIVENYSPVKNAEGGKSPESCRSAFAIKWSAWLLAAGIDNELCDRVLSDRLVEIDPAFACNSITFVERVHATEGMLEAIKQTLLDKDPIVICENGNINQYGN